MSYYKQARCANNYRQKHYRFRYHGS